MAKHGKRKKFRRYMRGAVNEELSLTTLAARTLTATSFDYIVQERTFISSIVARWALNKFTAAAGDGPILVGVAHGDYSTTEIEEWIENTGSWDEGNLISSKEIGRRLCKKVGIFRMDPGDAGTGSYVLENGIEIHTKLNWVLNQGKTLLVWAYNLGDSAIATTVPVVKVEGHANLWPQ